MPESANRLALLIGAPWRGEAAMHGDVQAFYDALTARGMSSDDLLVLEGRLDRELVLAFLASANPEFPTGIAAIFSFTTAVTAPMPRWTRPMPPRLSRRSFSARMT